MLRLHRHRHQSKPGEKLDFKFSGFKALQVPKGWDKIVVSFVSVETGKTVAKTSRASVRNGSCQWDETVSESIRVSEDNDSSKESESFLVKLIVSMGSARSGVLGEATLNVMDYASSSDCVPVSLSLKKCTHGTTLQMKIQCVTPRLKSRDEESKLNNSELEKHYENDQDIKFDGSESDSTRAKSLRSSSTKDFQLNSKSGEIGSRETSFSLSESHHSYDSAEGSLGGEDMSGSENQSENSRQDFPGSSLTNTSSAKNFREASEGTVEELRAEAKMWEMNARKLMLDLEVLKGEFSDLSRIQEDLSIELSEVRAERDGLKKEVEQLRSSSEKSLAVQTSLEDLARDDLRFQKESNADLAMQLKRSHESNIELVSVLQELEETVERQKIEIEDLQALQSKPGDPEKVAEENAVENRKLKDQVQQLCKSEKNLNGEVKLLKQALEEKNQQIEMGNILNSQTFLDVENGHKSRILGKEEEIVGLKTQLLGTLYATNGNDSNLMREIEELKEKVQELERDCNELTEENLELLLKLKESNNESARMSTSVEFPNRTSFEFQLSDQQFHVDSAEESSEKKGLEEMTNDGHASVQELQSLIMELEAKLTKMENELAEKRRGMEKLQANLRSREEEILVLRQCRSELEAKVSGLRKEKAHIRENIEVVLQESEISSKCLNDLQNDLVVLTSSVDSHPSANKVLERKSSELETGNRELELHVTELERENTQLSVLVACLEAQLKGLASQLESSQLELESSRSHSVSLNNEVDRLRSEMQSTFDSFILECDFLRKSNGELNNENLGLHDNCSILEAKLEEAREGLLDSSKKVDELEGYLSSVMAEFASKEKSLILEIDTLVDQNSRHKEKVDREMSLLNQMHTEKVVEAQKLQEEVENLIKKLSKTREENERIASDAQEEMARLRADNAKLESDFRDIQFRVRLTENELKNKEMDSEVKLKRLSSKLVDADQEHEKLLNLVENYKSAEAKFKTMVSDLELKLTVSEYQRQQLSDDSSYLKEELKRLAHLEHELRETKVEKEKLEALVRAMSEERNGLKSEKNELIEKISSLTTKLMQIDDDLAEVDVLRVREDELNNENKQYRLKIDRLQEERDESQRQYQALEEELKVVKEEKQAPKEQHGTRKASSFLKTNTKVNPVQEAAKITKNEMGKSVTQRRDNRRNQSQRENGGGGCESPEGSPRDNRTDLGSKIQLLEDQLAKALEENSKYKVQLNKLVSENRIVHPDVLKRSSTSEGELVSKAKFEHTKSILEAELRDIRDRYSSMSLKYAEVESQREELVMRLKSTARTSSKRWFS